VSIATDSDISFITGLAILVDDQNAHHDPSATELEKWNSERLRGIKEQSALAEEHEAREALNPDRAMSEKAILKRKERGERKGRGKANHRDNNESLSTPSATESDADYIDAILASLRREIPRVGVTVARNSATPYTVHVPGASSAFEWYALSDHSFTTLAAARDAGIWDYPETPLQRARCAVFRDLWEQGYFIGGGIKFGGEYLVYPGMFVLPLISSTFYPPPDPRWPSSYHARLNTACFQIIRTTSRLSRVFLSEIF
jgi:tRNA-splicing endonuclease subunit Sen34